MDRRKDFLQWLQTDMGINILSCLDDPADLVRASTVSHFWHHFVIANGLCKQLCWRRFPQLSGVDHITKTNCRSSSIGSSNYVEWKIHEANHNVHASLLQILNLSILSPFDCMFRAISASSTDNYPDESIINTLNPRDRDMHRASYWSSSGQEDPAVPETLIYKLRSNFCVVNEIKIQPFEAFFQTGSPIYSARFVRFRMGHPKSQSEMERILQDVPIQHPADDKFVWTYTSQDFPMAQEDCLQEFKLPEPVLCIGGFLQIELFGRVQKQQMDGLYYICVAHVKVIGRPLSPAFDVEILEPSGKFCLKYHPEALNRTAKSTCHGAGGEDIRDISTQEILWGREGLLEYPMGNQPDPEYNDYWDQEDEEDEEDEEEEEEEEDDDDVNGGSDENAEG